MNKNGYGPQVQPPKYLNEFSKALAGEVRILLAEVGKLRDERRALQYEIAELMQMKSKHGAGGEFSPDWRPRIEAPLLEPPPPPPPAIEAPPPPPARPAWRVVHKRPERRPRMINAPPPPPPAPVPVPAPEPPKPELPAWAQWKPNPLLAPTPAPIPVPMTPAPPVRSGLFGPSTPPPNVWMHPFASYVLRSYYKATGWNEDNLYANLTRSSNAILDFTVPKGLHLSISKSPNTLFNTTYSITALPSLNGSVGYIATSCDLNVKGSGNVQFKDMIERFRVYDQPRKPEGKDEEWVAGERIDARDYLLYGRLYLPSGRLDALYTTRLSSTMQALVAAVSHPLPSGLPGRSGDPSNIMFNLQHDVGKWCTEYSYSAEDGMWGLRVLHNFGRLGQALEPSDDNSLAHSRAGLKRVDEEDAIEGGLKGRVSAGAELYLSAKEKSAGGSIGLRFTTLPDATPPSFQVPSSSPLSLVSKGQASQPPTTITALFNPILGHMSGAYSAQVSRDLCLSSRFDFNVYSFESEWTMGAEWWMRRTADVDRNSQRGADPLPLKSPSSLHSSEVHGVVKARASTNNDISLMWEGRIRNMLVSLGVVADVSSKFKPIKAIGLELSYFSSG
ncbi:Mitochondrial distribution and morphology protein 10 [Tricholoma furcatifolium]|nr:Mitochondrial distribution and morphology protein 10 [Tricholoma furcatifolium]